MKPQSNWVSMAFLYVLVALLPLLVVAQNETFTKELNARWQTHDASNVLSYVEAQLAVSPNNPQILTARGIIAASLQEWGVGATNYLAQAIDAVNQNSQYPASQKKEIVQELAGLTNLFAAISKSVGEASSTNLHWSTNTHSVVFEEIGDEFPFLYLLNKFTITGSP